MLKTIVLLHIFLLYSLMNRKLKKNSIFKMEIICNIINLVQLMLSTCINLKNIYILNVVYNVISNTEHTNLLDLYVTLL